MISHSWLLWSSNEADEVENFGHSSGRECDARLAFVFDSDDGSDLQTSVRRSCLVCAKTKYRVILGLAAVASVCLCAVLIRSRHDQHALISVNADGTQSKVDTTVLMNSIVKSLWGNADPFQFRCPVPLPLLVSEMVGNNNNATNKQTAHLSKTDQCCERYNASWWPYQYPECHQDRDSDACPSCWKTTTDAQPSSKSTVANVAGVAWAAATAVYEREHEESKNQMLGGRMMATLTEGLRPHVTNVCPKITDWRQYTFEVEKEDLLVRAFKSTKAKVAIISFRGTEPSELSNWMVDFNTATEKFHLGKNGPTANVHSGFLDALRHMMPKIRKWVNGYWAGFGKVPADWKLVFTGHSMGAAFAILAATMAFVEEWERAPDAIVTFAGPRIADETLSNWWQNQGLCGKLLRVLVYNDMVHWLPFAKQSSLASASFEKCMLDMKSCFRSQLHGHGHFDDWWRHVCPDSEFLVPGAMKGVNGQLTDFNIVGGGLAHKIGDCSYGYGYGVLHTGIANEDPLCGITPEICPSFECTSSEDLSGKHCSGLHKDIHSKSPAECRQSCCIGRRHGEYGTCDVWQWLKNGECWLGRSYDCTTFSIWAHEAVNGSRID